MANYQNLKAAIDQVIKTNGQKEITGPVLNDMLKAIVNSLGAGYQFMGVATPTANPGTPDQNVFYLAGKAGTYANFNSIVLPDGVSILKWNGSWSSETVLVGDGVFDISAYKATGGTLATFADLSAALDGGNNIPSALRKGGMSVKFVQSSDNKYVQFRCMADEFTTDVTQWQGVDNKLTAGSHNIAQCGSVSIFGLAHNGFINNGIWKNLSTNERTYVIFELFEGLDSSPVTIKGSADGNSIVCFLSEYNPVEDGNASVLLQKIISANQVVNETIPSGTRYIYFLYISDTNRMPAQFVVNGIDLIKDTPYVTMSGITALSTIKKNINNVSYKLWSLGDKPNVDTQNNTLTFSSATTINIGGVDYTIPANTVVSLTAQGGSVYSTIIYNLKTGVFNAIRRDTDYNTLDNILIGFAVIGGNNTKKRYYFPFSYTIDGNDIETLSEGIDTLSENIETLSESVEYINKDYYGQGYINAGNWADIGSGDRYYYCIPIFVKDGSTFEIQYNATAASVLYFLSQNNPVSGQSASAVSNAMIGTNTTIIGEVPSGAKYLYMLAESDGSRMPQNVIIDGVDYLKPIKESLASLSYNINNQIAGSSILALNPEASVKTRLNNLKVHYANYGVSDNYPEVVSFLHFSDLHGNNVNLLRIQEFMNKYGSQINDVIQTGDLIPGVVTDGVPTDWGNVAKDWLSVIGNHDATIRENNLWVTVPPKTSYDAVFAPYIDNWNVVQPEDAEENGYCYYYKDYSASNLRLIVLDNMQSLNGGATHWDATQKAWFESVLADAKTNGLQVIVAVHYIPFLMVDNKAITSFDSVDMHPTTSNWFVSEEIPNAIKDFIDDGGVFVCYLCGHTHMDFFGVAQSSDWSNQLAISIASASYDAGSGIYGESDRTICTKGQDCFNIIGIDTTSKTIKLMRVGLEYDRYMRRKNTLSWNYGTSQLIYTD